MLKDVDSGERAFLIRALSLTVSACGIISAAVAYYLAETRQASGLTMLAVVALGLLVGVALGFGSWYLAGRAGAGAAHVLLSAGNLPPAPSFSYQESLVARGRYQEAVDAFEAHLLDHPDDLDASLAMAGILAGHLRQFDQAAQVYRRVREAGSPTHEFRAHQALIDLHRATGDRGRLMTELARFADRFRGTAAGRAARVALTEMKADQ